MRLRHLLIIGFLLLIYPLAAQPPETIYPGTVAHEGYEDDAFYGPFNIGFTFNYYGANYTQFHINSNGQVLFGAPSLESNSIAIPNTAAPNNFIAPFWDDLVIDSYGKILYTTIGVSPNRKLIIQFKNMGFYPFPATLGTFYVILYEGTNIIKIQYRLLVLSYSAKGHGSTATIGLENAAGTAGIQYAYNNPTAVNTEQAISFTPIAGPSYSVNSNAVYDGVYLTTNEALPEPGIATLVNPPLDAVIGSDFTFEWESATNAASYTLYIGTDPELASAASYPAGSDLSYDISGLTLDQTYYWGVFSQNTTGTTWCEIKRFTTSSTPPLVPVPQTIYTEQGNDKTISLSYSGGDASPKTAIITSLPGQGQLYQYNAGVRGTPISTVPTPVSDVGMNVIYAASGGTGNGVGSFNFRINDANGDSPEGTITVNVSPPGVPNVLYIAKKPNLEIQFDTTMANPAGKQNQFTVKVNGTPAVINSASLKTGDPYTILLTLATPLTGTETVLLSYTPGDIAGSTGGLLLPFTDIPVTLTSQTITFTQSLSKKYSDSPFVLVSSSSSGLPMSYSSSNLFIATIINNIATFHSVGNSNITARQIGDATFAPAKYIRTLTVAKGDQTITFNVLPGKTYGDADFPLTGTASSGLTVSYSSDNTSVATITGNQVHIVGAGSAVITASQAGNTLWNPATNVPRTLTVSKADQTITFGPIPVKTYGDIDFNPSATSSSGLPVSYASDNTGVATIAGGQIHIAGGGNAVITASQIGNANYNAAISVPQTLTVNKALLTAIADNKTKTYGNQNPVLTISYSGFIGTDNKDVLDDEPDISTTALQNSDVGIYPITLSGGSDNSYNFSFTSGELTITKADQTISITGVPEKLNIGDSYTLTATSSSGLAVQFESLDPDLATVSGNIMTGVSKGDAEIRAYNEGDMNYNSAEAFATVEISSTHKDIMNLFTPNGDGINDYWELPELSNWGKSDVRVFNRWGKLVFADPDYNNLWDGTSNGSALPEGPYYFVIETENEGMVKGTVNIVR